MKSNNASTPSLPPALHLRIGLKGVDQATFSTAFGDPLGKQRVSIMLDNTVIAFLKEKAGVASKR